MVVSTKCIRAGFHGRECRTRTCNLTFPIYASTPLFLSILKHDLNANVQAYTGKDQE